MQNDVPIGRMEFVDLKSIRVINQYSGKITAQIRWPSASLLVRSLLPFDWLGVTFWVPSFLLLAHFPGFSKHDDNLKPIILQISIEVSGTRCIMITRAIEMAGDAVGNVKKNSSLNFA